jgi:ATP-dependent 26S proteasome regulatory subunit
VCCVLHLYHLPPLQDKFDTAVLRRGRFSMQVALEVPDRKAREKLFKKYLAPVKIATIEVQVQARCFKLTVRVVA